MGTVCSNEIKEDKEGNKKMHENDKSIKKSFTKLYSIGKGGFGKVK